MYYDYNGNEIEDLEMDNMRRDAREEEREKRMRRTYEVVSIQADDPESSYRVYYNVAQVQEQLPHLAPLICDEDFHSIKLVNGLNSLEVTICCEEEEDIEEHAWATYQAESGQPICEECMEGMGMYKHTCGKDEEEFGTPNASYCNSSEPDHNGGWFCHHPDCVTAPDEVHDRNCICQICVEF